MHEERYRRGAKRAARVITVSRATQTDVETVLRLPPERIRTIYSAPDPAFSSPTDASLDDIRQHDQQALERYSIRPPFILYAGAIRPQKNIPRLVEAFAVLRQQLEKYGQYSDLSLVIT